MRIFIVLTVFLALLVGCETDEARYQRAQPDFWRQAKMIPTGQPVTQTNADVLASVYWQRHCSNCGMVYPVRDDGKYWSAHVVAGMVPVDRPDILIEKATGYISMRGGPTVTNWCQLWR